MPQDPYLYGQPRPNKKQKRDGIVSTTLSFASQLTSLMAAPSATSRPRALRTARSAENPDVVKVRRKNNRADHTGNSLDPSSATPGFLSLEKKSSIPPDDPAERTRVRHHMEEKARLYAAMKRGDYIAREGEAPPLVDFDRKWAEEQARSNGAGRSPTRSSSPSFSSDNADPQHPDDKNAKHETVEYEDEFGRLRTTTRAELARRERRAARAAAAAAELETMTARPTVAPDNLIIGDFVQSAAFTSSLDAATAAKQAELAARRDRSPTPPPKTHYDAASEVRDKGVGFYTFSCDEEMRAREQAALAARRDETERARQKIDDMRHKRQAALEARRRSVQERAARRQAFAEARRETNVLGAAEMARRQVVEEADSFLNGLEKDMAFAAKGV